MKGFLYFTAAWCQPCETLGPIMDAVQRSGIPVNKINVDYDVEFVQEYRVMNIPTVILYEQGGRGEIGRRTGVQTQQSLMEWFNNG